AKEAAAMPSCDHGHLDAADLGLTPECEMFHILTEDMGSPSPWPINGLQAVFDRRYPGWDDPPTLAVSSPASRLRHLPEALRSASEDAAGLEEALRELGGEELGCGAGLCGLAFAKATGADGEDDVLELAKRNVELNGLHGVNVRCLDLGFMQEEEGKALIEEFGKFPLVVGSDMIFEPGQTARVLAAADQLLDSEGGRCVLALSSAFQNFAVTPEAQGEVDPDKQNCDRADLLFA
ncbi:unnamed protein product, partial [Polarella glacialis]